MLVYISCFSRVCGDLVFISPPYMKAVRGDAVGLGTALQAGRSRVRFPLVSLAFFIDIILPAALWPGVDSASNRNENQEYFLGVKKVGA